MADLYRGDCLDKIRGMDVIHTCITDPPYGMAFQSAWPKAGPRHKRLASDDRVDPRWLHAVREKMDEGAALLMFCNWKTSDEWRRQIECAGLEIKSQVIWDRQAHGMGDLFGAFAPQHDVIWYATLGRRKFVNGRPTSVLRHRRAHQSEDHGHPTCKPVALMADLIRATDDGSGAPVFDPFMGSGSTGVACAELGQPFIGCELDPEYYATAERRIHGADASRVAAPCSGF